MSRPDITPGGGAQEGVDIKRLSDGKILVTGDIPRQDPEYYTKGILFSTTGVQRAEQMAREQGTTLEQVLTDLASIVP